MRFTFLLNCLLILKRAKLFLSFTHTFHSCWLFLSNRFLMETAEVHTLLQHCKVSSTILITLLTHFSSFHFHLAIFFLVFPRITAYIARLSLFTTIQVESNWMSNRSEWSLMQRGKWNNGKYTRHALLYFGVGKKFTNIDILPTVKCADFSICIEFLNSHKERKKKSIFN